MKNFKLVRKMLLPAVIAVLATPPAPAAQVRPGGVWLMQNHKAEVELGTCGDALCGRVVRVLKYPKDGARSDIHNSDPALRGRPLVGLPVLVDFHGDGGQFQGRAYDPKSGRSYRATMRFVGNDRMVLKACLLFICKTQEWTRVGS